MDMGVGRMIRGGVCLGEEEEEYDEDEEQDSYEYEVSGSDGGV